MHIGINASFLRKPMTGIGQVTKEFLTLLAQTPQFSEHTWYLYTDGELTEEQKKNISIAKWQWRPVSTWWKRADIPHQYLFESQALPGSIKEDNLDIFLSLYQSATVLPQNLRHVMLVHDIIPKLFPEYLTKWTSRLYYGCVLQALPQASHLLTPSLTIKEDLLRVLNIEAEKITPVPLGVNKRFFEQLGDEKLREKLQAYELTPGYLYHGGGLEIRKNTEAVLRAYAELMRENFTPLPPLAISGKVYAETNPLATPVRRLMQELGIGKRVKLLGLVPEEDLPFLYQGASIFLFPSRYEGFGLPIVEAYASGTPVIATQAGSLKELVTKEEAFVIHDPLQAEKVLKDGIKALLTHPEKSRELREQGLIRARQYTWENFTTQVSKALLQ